ncbi:MAG TPA: hypothetical protein VM802_23620 [Chitinophaga sp.]|uniref:hypothetical protein n=1 Tax=Chitinophaga sp. TaxID=1869181 RepID=UPI002C8C9B39|nr:hypothetical protein [Chitinophaga sp.]HVI47878.1 hypothetical protein [Chitinophaga sp.]
MKHVNFSTAPLVYLIALAFTLASCKSSRLIGANEANISGNYCAPATRYNYDPGSIPLRNTDSLLAANTDMPVRELAMANAAGVLLLVRSLRGIAQDSSVEGRLRRMEIGSAIQHRILTASVEMDGIAAELDCEGERADQLARFLDDYNNKRNTKLTVASIIVGAITTIATVAIKENGPQNAVAIGGGLLSAGLGAMTINAARKKISLQHPRNLLSDIWYAPDSSSLYPPFIWYVLNEKHFSNSGQLSLIQSIRKRWLEFDLGKKLSHADEQLYFGTGGIYKADNLHTRAAMLNELQSTVRSISQDLQGLLEYLTHYR